MNLGYCFFCDGLSDIAPQPREVFELLIRILKDNGSNEELRLWVQTQELSDWSPEFEDMYPDGYRTYIHISGLTYALANWVYNIGHFLIGLPQPYQPQKYFSWVKRDWVFVYTFINGLHRAYFDLARDVDKADKSGSGYSFFEALHVSQKSQVSFEKAADKLKERRLSHDNAMNRIRSAISGEYYLEAITLEECLISNCLFNFLDSKGVSAKGYSFKNLIKGCKKSCDRGGELMTGIDIWRSSRNRAIHGYVQSTLSSFESSHDAFIRFSKDTSEKGLELCEAIFAWYSNEAVNFVPTEFSDDDRTLN